MRDNPGWTGLPARPAWQPVARQRVHPSPPPPWSRPARPPRSRRTAGAAPGWPTPSGTPSRPAERRRPVDHGRSAGPKPVSWNRCASVGEVLDASGLGELLTVTLTENLGNLVGPFPVAYALDDTGLFRIHYNPLEPVHGFASGYLGGSDGAEIVAAASDSTPGRTWWLLAGRARTWTGAETVADFQGAYPFVDFAVRGEGAAIIESHGANGTLAFDGLGAFTYEVQTAGGTMYGTGTYTVDADAERLTATVGGNTFLLAAGPDLGLLYGISVSDPDLVEVLVIGR